MNLTTNPVVSLPVRLMAKPFAGYRELGREPASEEGRRLVLGLARFVFVVGAFVTVTATGRFAPLEAIGGMIGFAWLPVVHAAGIALTTRLLAPRVSFRRAFGLYVQGLGPWMIVFLILSGSCLFAPQPARPVFMLLGPLLGVASLWSVVLVFAMFRAGLDLPRGRAAGATALFLVTIHLLVLGYYFAAGQLWPVL